MDPTTPPWDPFPTQSTEAGTAPAPVTDPPQRVNPKRPWYRNLRIMLPVMIGAGLIGGIAGTLAPSPPLTIHRETTAQAAGNPSFQPPAMVATVQPPAAVLPTQRRWVRPSPPPTTVDAPPESAPIKPTITVPPEVKPKPGKPTRPGKVRFRSCAEMHAAGIPFIVRGEPGYSKELDTNRDGIACNER